ncbi:MAG: type 1 glutamine amidotransferase domain-containing protein, partial [Phyllobacterium sp.]
MKVLIVLTSHDALGDTGKKTGFWLEEFVAPYYTFLDAGASVTVASPKGGQPPLDPKSDLPESRTEATERFARDEAAQQVLAETEVLAQVDDKAFDAIFYPGGHGPLWDLTADAVSIGLIERFYDSGRPVGAVCHAPAALLRAKAGGKPLVSGKRVTGFSNSEEEAVELTDIVPLLVEDELKRLGGLYEKAGDWQSFVLVDGHLVTGQNPASSSAVAGEMLA